MRIDIDAYRKLEAENADLTKQLAVYKEGLSLLAAVAECTVDELVAEIKRKAPQETKESNDE
jgi:hypothetical protein